MKNTPRPTNGMYIDLLLLVSAGFFIALALVTVGSMVFH
jgi:hypothetical protein